MGSNGCGARPSSGMNVMIPMAGLGSRFAAEGYRSPKPLINIVGRPMLFWLLDNLKFATEDTLWVGIQQELGVEHAIEARLRREYPALDLRVVTIDFHTRGAAETLFIMLQHMSPLEVRRKSISLDCDTIYFSDVLGASRACPDGCGCSFYFQDEGDKGTNNIVHIREKVAISRHANTGAYAFPCGEQLRGTCREVLDNPVEKAGEFYTSSIIEGMIHAGQKFVGIHVPSFSCVGTPGQLRAFLSLVRAGVISPRHKARVCFDLDRSLLTTHSPAGMAEKASIRPVERNVRLLQELKAAGNYIIAETSRTKQPPTGESKEYGISGPGALTSKSLRDFGICYDEIVFGKPVADVYIDGRTGNSPGDMEREVGWCLRDSEEGKNTITGRDNFMTPRSFNRITSLDDKHIVKSAPFEYFRGELHFYRSIPPTLSNLFPKLVEANDDPTLDLPSITITKVEGVSFSHLVTNHCVTRGRFVKLLRGLGAIHATKKPPTVTQDYIGVSTAAEEAERLRAKVECVIAPSSEPLQRPISPERPPGDLPPSTLCANLHSKVSRRLEVNKAAYTAFDGVDVPGISRTILSHLLDYQEGARFQRADFVHGDPVFSNCLLNKESEVIFVDMRGSLGDTLCTDGDVNYDLSKVYQSLCGYDFMILDKELDPTAVGILRDLEENVFWPFVRDNYPGSLPRDIAVLAASHFLSIVPLHERRQHQARFLKECGSILSGQYVMNSTAVEVHYAPTS